MAGAAKRVEQGKSLGEELRGAISSACMAGRVLEACSLLSRMEPVEAQEAALEELESAAWTSGPAMVRALLPFCHGREECGSALLRAVEMASTAEAQSSSTQSVELMAGLLQSIRLLLEAAPYGSAVASAFRAAAHAGDAEILKMFIGREECKPARGAALLSAAWATQAGSVSALLACQGITREELGIAFCAALEQEDFDCGAPVTSTMFDNPLEALAPEELRRVSERARAVGHLVGALRAEALLEAWTIGEASAECMPKIGAPQRSRL